MKTTLSLFTASFLASAATVTLVSCANPGVQRTAVITTQPGKPGGVALETSEEVAVVTAINTAKRTITLHDQDGQIITYKAVKGVANLNQFQLGQNVKITVAEELAVSVTKKGTPSDTISQAEVAFQAKGASQGIFVTESKKITAKITAINVYSRKLTLAFADGSSRKITVGYAVNIFALKVGDDVSVGVTKAIVVHP